MSATGVRYSDGRMSYRCDTCGLVAPWDDAWMWFGSYLEQEGGVLVPTYCGRCATRAKSKTPKAVKL